VAQVEAQEEAAEVQAQVALCLSSLVRSGLAHPQGLPLISPIFKRAWPALWGGSAAILASLEARAMLQAQEGADLQLLKGWLIIYTRPMPICGLHLQRHQGVQCAKICVG
jgi:hypothetical protein